MKKETIQNKLAELLGLEQFKIDTKKSSKSSKPSEKHDLPVGLTEDQLQNFRAAQGITYFLQAPELFTAKTCPHCNESFLVSRQYVAFCSYTCIEKDLASKGIKWSRSGDIDGLIEDVYEGNEPIWIKNLDRLQAVLTKVHESSLKPAPSESETKDTTTSEDSASNFVSV